MRPDSRGGHAGRHPGGRRLTRGGRAATDERNDRPTSTGRLLFEKQKESHDPVWERPRPGLPRPNHYPEGLMTPKMD